MGSVLTDDGTAERVVLAILWYAKGVVDASDDNQKPSYNTQDLVGQESLVVVRLSTREGVCWGVSAGSSTVYIFCKRTCEVGERMMH